LQLFGDNATLEETMMFEIGDVVKHEKTGNSYLITGTPARVLIEATETPAYTYRQANGNDDRIWVRPQDEMEDGRFVMLQKQPFI